MPDAALPDEVADLRSRLAEAEDTLRAISCGEVDGLVIAGQVYTLQGAETPYRTLIEAMSQGAATLAADGVILYCNTELSNLLHVPLESLVGTTLRRFAMPADVLAFDALFEESRHSSRGEIVFHCPDGSIVPVDVAFSLLLAEGAATVGVVVTDQTQRKRTETALLRARDSLEARVAERTSELKAANFSLWQSGLSARKLMEEAQSARAAMEKASASLRISEERFRLMAESIGDIIWLLDATTGAFLYVSPAFEKLFGFPPSALYTNQHLWMEYIDTADRAQVLRANAALRRGLDYDVEFRILKSDDGVRWIHNRGYAVRDANGKVAMACGVAADISEQKAMGEALASAKQVAETASRAKSTFLAHMSHEIRTPLHVIIGLSQSLRRGLDNPAQQARLDQIGASSDYLLSIINDILDLSKAEASQLKLDAADFRLDTVVDRVLRMIEGRALEKGLTLTAELPAAIRGIALSGDPLRLAQVLINLCTNALNFTDVGEVRLRVDVLAEEKDGAALRLRFSVEDSGIGIVPADQARLFEPFVQADNSMSQ
jgi:two-component system sensor histidine kinase/response regulator